jgi:hypothetical protein
VVGEEEAGTTELAARPDTVTTYRVHVTAPRAALDGDAADLAMILTNPATGETARRETVFRGPE